jgi:glyoxylase-like metal-dependent hydrolase (beta-lactamase superfamily II)
MKEVAPDIFVESTYPPYNLVLIKTEKGGLVIDIPPNPVQAMNWLEQARATAGGLRYVVLTDGGRDRQMATAICEVPMIASEATLRVMEAYEDERAQRDFIEELSTRYPEEVEAIDNLEPRKPTVAFNEHFTLYAETRTFEFEVVDGAATGSLWVFVPEEKLLITGETVVGDAVPMMSTVPDSKAWLNTMTSLAHREGVKQIIPGRGRAMIHRAEIEPQREFMRVMRRAARTLARKSGSGLSLSQTAQELGQTFFNAKGQQAIKEIKAGLSHLVAEVEAQDANEEEPESSS